MGDFTLSNRLKILVTFVCLSPLLFLFLYVNYNNGFKYKSTGVVFLEIRIKEECIGKVKSIYRQKMNHNVLALETSNCIFQVDADWETKFEVGDSISKRKGELILKHYREGKLIEILDYNDIAKNMK
ncbi:hypothetical protein [Flavobacterium sp. JP2137]|uniref:hypothetical protein n=1 Tax=Flavobacterium sp. JP2137 TaxID=3414510 RepID=UPI003D2FA208